MLMPPAVAGAATYSVTTTADSNSGSCEPAACTLRQALNAANAAGDADVVTLPAGAYGLEYGQLEIKAPVTVTGLAGSGATTVDAQGASRVFSVSVGATATLEGIAIVKGLVKGTSAAQAMGGGILNAGALTLKDVTVKENTAEPADSTGTSPSGGGVQNSGTLVLVGSTIEGNLVTAVPYVGGIPTGGGIANVGGIVEATDSVIARNQAQSLKGGIPDGGGLASLGEAAHGAKLTLTKVLVEANAAIEQETGGIPEGGGMYASKSDLTVSESAVTGNKAAGGSIADAGGIYASSEGTFLLERSLVASNRVESTVFADGGGLNVYGYPADSQAIVNSTITGNEAIAPTGGSGGGILHGGFGASRLEVSSSTISENSADSSGGTGNGGNLFDPGQEGRTTVLLNTIVANGSAKTEGGNCYGAGIQSAGHNIDSLDECNFTATGDQVNTNPLIGPLASNGGPTQSMALLSGSPAIDAGGLPCPPTDQRGVPRPQGPGCDIGAYEVVVPPPPPPSPEPASPSDEALLNFRAGKVRVNHKGKGALPVRCRNVAGDLCKVRLVIWRYPSKRGAAGKSAARRVKLGAIVGEVSGQGNGRLRVQLNKKGRGMLPGSPSKKLKVRVIGASRNLANQPVQIDRALRLSPKAKRKRG